MPDPTAHAPPVSAALDVGDGDDALMLAFAGGDASAFERLYARHQAGLWRFTKRLLGPALAAQTDEVFQDTWLKVVQARDRWEPRLADGTTRAATFRTWLYTLAHHRAIDLLRRSGREVSVDGAGDGDGDDASREPWQPDASSGEAWQHWPPPASAAAKAEDVAFWRRAGEKLLDCLDQLPVAQRSAFLLHHDDGLALDEVARALEVGFETAKTRLRYAMAKLRTCMGAYLDPMRGGTA